MRLVDDLLDGNFTAPPLKLKGVRESGRTLSRIRVAPQRVDLSETCAGLLSQLSDALALSESRRRGVVTISSALAKQIVEALKEAESDPFARGGSGSIDTDDLERLGVQVVKKSSSDRGGDPFAGEEEEEAQHSLGFGNTEDPIPASAAIVAPSATPGGDSKIPEEVLRTMEILMSPEKEVPLTPSEPTSNSALRGMFGGQEQEEEEGSDPQSQLAPEEEEGGEESPAEMAQRIRKTLANSRNRTATMTEADLDPNQHEIVSIKRRMTGGRKPTHVTENTAGEADFLAKIAGLGG